MNVSDLKLLVKAIVINQSSIIGPIAIEQANRVPGLKVSDDISEITINGDGKNILPQLVKQFEILFGQASVEACKESVRQVLGKVDPKEVPAFLK